MAEYRISSAMYKRIQERKNSIYLHFGICAVIQIAIFAFCVLSGRNGIILGSVLEPLFLYIVWRYLRFDFRTIKHKNSTGVIIKKIAERTVNRTGVVSGNPYGGWRGETKYILHINSSGKDHRISLPTKDAFVSYNEGDEVLLIEALPYPVITSRIPSPAVCPQCGHLLHYEDGYCHECGLEDIYPDFCNTPKWEKK